MQKLGLKRSHSRRWAIFKPSGQRPCSSWPRIRSWDWTHTPEPGRDPQKEARLAMALHGPVASPTDHFHGHSPGGISHPLLGNRPKWGCGLPQEGAKLPVGHGGESSVPGLGTPGLGTPHQPPASPHTSRRSRQCAALPAGNAISTKKKINGCTNIEQAEE